jgi:hypothetical protein
LATFNWYQSQTLRQELNRFERLCRRPGMVWRRSLLRPRVMLLVERPPPLMELQRTLVWNNSPLSLSNSSSKGRLTSSKRSSRILKTRSWFLPLHQMNRPMLYPKKKPRAREEEREIRNPTTLLPLTMIIYLPLAHSLRYPLVKPPISMGQTIPNRDTR